ncbi:hypothetical protein BH10PSE6_BH10PSE6_19110 [soil metagenome]
MCCALVQRNAGKADRDKPMTVGAFLRQLKAINAWGTFLIPSPPAGPVPVRTTLRTRLGSLSTMSCATKPPREKPSKSTSAKPSARTKAIVSSAISATVSGALPPDAPTPDSLRRSQAWSQQAVDNAGIEVIQYRAPMIQHDHRDTARRSELPVDDLRPCTIDASGRARPSTVSSSWSVADGMHSRSPRICATGLRLGAAALASRQGQRRSYRSLTTTLPFERPAST